MTFHMNRDLTSRPHIAGLPEDLASAEVIEERWKKDGLKVFKPKYNVLLSYPDDNNVNQYVMKSLQSRNFANSLSIIQSHTPPFQ